MHDCFVLASYFAVALLKQLLEQQRVSSGELLEQQRVSSGEQRQMLAVAKRQLTLLKLQNSRNTMLPRSKDSRNDDDQLKDEAIEVSAHPSSIFCKFVDVSIHVAPTLLLQFYDVDAGDKHVICMVTGVKVSCANVGCPAELVLKKRVQNIHHA